MTVLVSSKVIQIRCIMRLLNTGIFMSVFTQRTTCGMIATPALKAQHFCQKLRTESKLIYFLLRKNCSRESTRRVSFAPGRKNSYLKFLSDLFFLFCIEYTRIYKGYSYTYILYNFVYNHLSTAM